MCWNRHQLHTNFCVNIEKFNFVPFIQCCLLWIILSIDSLFIVHSTPFEQSDFFFENLFQSSWKIEKKIEILIFCLIILHFKFSESSQIFSSKSFTKSWSFMIPYFSVVTESGCESFLWLSKCIAADLEWYMLLFLLNFWAISQQRSIVTAFILCPIYRPIV